MQCWMDSDFDANASFSARQTNPKGRSQEHERTRLGKANSITNNQGQKPEQHAHID